jgi:hypothetical protein
MKTLAVTTQTNGSRSEKTGLLQKQIALFEQYRFGLLPIMLTAQSCIGSIAAMYIVKNGMNVAELSAVAMLTMAANAVIIAQASPKLCLISFYVVNTVNVLFILFNLL